MVGCRRQLEKSKLKPGTRVALDMTTLTIMRYLPREVGNKKVLRGSMDLQMRSICHRIGCRDFLRVTLVNESVSEPVIREYYASKIIDLQELHVLQE